MALLACISKILQGGIGNYIGLHVIPFTLPALLWLVAFTLVERPIVYMYNICIVCRYTTEIEDMLSRMPSGLLRHSCRNAEYEAHEKGAVVLQSFNSGDPGNQPQELIPCRAAWTCPLRTDLSGVGGCGGDIAAVGWHLFEILSL